MITIGIGVDQNESIPFFDDQASLNLEKKKPPSGIVRQEAQMQLNSLSPTQQ